MEQSDEPFGLGEKGGNNVRQIHHANAQKNSLDPFRCACHHDRPHQYRCQWDGYKPAHAECFAGPKYAGEFRHHIAQIDDQHHSHQEKGHPKAEFFPN